MASNKYIRIKIVTVGPSDVGKTCLLFKHFVGQFPMKWTPMVFDSYSEELDVYGKRCIIEPWDTACREEAHNRLRPLSYPDTSVFLLCFSVDSEPSLTDCIQTWVPELQHHAPGVPCILVATKVDLRTSPKCLQCIPYDHGYQVAKQNHMDYMETSALMQYGLKELFDKAFEVAMNHTDQERLNLKKTLSEPILPDVYIANAPWGDMELSMYSEQMVAALQDPQAADLVFLIEGVREVKCHKVILCSASDFFCQVFGKEVLMKDDKPITIPNLDWHDINAGKVSGLSSITETMGDKGSLLTQIAVSEDISFGTFSNVLYFLYTGLPILADCVDDAMAEELKRVSMIFHLPYLRQVIDNIQNGRDDLNPSIGTYHMERMGQRLKALFFGSDTFSDVKLNIKGSSIPAHKVVLMSRCEVMAKMFSENYEEANQKEVVLHDNDSKCFEVLLEYLYTDSAPIEEADALGILQVADKYGQDRLKYLCELLVIKNIDQSVRECVGTSEIDVISILAQSQVYNAKQLSSWCLHFIATNYTAFRERSEFSQLDGDNLDYILKNRWPPVSYLEEMSTYEDKMRGKDKKCHVM